MMARRKCNNLLYVFVIASYGRRQLKTSTQVIVAEADTLRIPWSWSVTVGDRLFRLPPAYLP